MKKTLLLAATHLLMGLAGFALGIYLLPIIAAPPAPSATEVQAAAAKASFTGEFKRGLKGSDSLHWGEGRVSVGPSAITLAGSVAPGPAYKLYLVPTFVETGDDFVKLKAQSLQVGDVKTFDNFIVPLPAGAAPDRYDTVLIWCEAFSQFITAAKYR